MDSTCANNCKVIFHCGFDLCFLDDCWCCASFHMFVVYLCISFGELSIQVLYPFLNCFLLLLLSGIIYALWILTPYQRYSMLIFSSILYVTSSLWLLCRCFWVWYSSTWLLLLFVHVLSVSYSTKHCQIQCHKHFSLFFIVEVV